MTTPPTGFLRFKKSIFQDIWEINNFFDFLMFLHHPSKFGEISSKIGGEIICQSRPLLTPFFNFRIVHCSNCFQLRSISTTYPCLCPYNLKITVINLKITEINLKIYPEITGTNQCTFLNFHSALSSLHWTQPGKV